MMLEGYSLKHAISERFMSGETKYNMYLQTEKKRIGLQEKVL